MSDATAPSPKILVLDIEWRPVKAYVWGAWKENIYDEKIIEDGGLLCIGLKFLGDKEVTMLSTWGDGHIEMLQKTRDLMAEADCIVGYNSDKYDLRKLEGEFIRYKIELPPQVASVDLYKVVKKLGYFKNSLGWVAPFLGIGKKVEHEGFRLWRKVMEGDEGAQRRMLKYCAGDVTLTERLYNRIKPAIRNHPNLGHAKGRCPTCGGKRLQSRGYRFTKLFQIQRIHCQTKGCSRWFDGKKEIIS